MEEHTTTAKLSPGCKDCIQEGFQAVIREQFQIIRIFIYVLSALAVTSSGSEIAKNVFGLIGK